MSRTILALSTVALLCASSQIAFADGPLHPWSPRNKPVRV